MTNDDWAARLLHHRAQDLRPGDPVPAPLVASSMFHLPGDGQAEFQYGRFSNPTWEAAEAALAIVEDAPVLLFPSGMAAVTALLMTGLTSGDRLILPADGYYAVRRFAADFLAPLGIRIDERPTATITEGGFAGAKLVWLETPSNPGLDIADIAKAAALAKAAGARLVVDNTTLTALGQRPLTLGADAVIVSGTKALNGHSDVMAGHVATHDIAWMERLKSWRKFSGAIPGTLEAWLLHRGLETLDLRYARMTETAERLAPRLAAHKAIRAIRFPGLAGDPGHALAKAQMQSFGFLIGLTFASAETADRFIAACRYLVPATSFGSVKSSAERRARWGDAVPQGYVRLSIGCEPTEHLWRALSEALDSVV